MNSRKKDGIKMVLKEKERIPKLVLLPSSIECRSFSLADKDNTFECYDCKGNLFYVRQQWGIVEEGQWMYDVMGYSGKDESHIAMRVVGLALFCAECGSFNEDYSKWTYPVEKTICTWDDDELDIADIEELKTAVDVFNRTGNVQLPYMSSQIKYLKKEVEAYFDKEKSKKK